MKFSSALLFGFALSAVNAYMPPAEQPDGAYEVAFDKNNNPITKRLVMSRIERRAPNPAPEDDPESHIERRDGFPGQQVACTNRDIAHFDYSVVDNCLSTWLDKNNGQKAWKTVYYCRKGNALLAICAYDDKIMGNRGEIANFNGVMDRTCGAYRSGFVYIKDWNKTFWRTTWGEEICGNAQGSDPRQQVWA